MGGRVHGHGLAPIAMLLTCISLHGAGVLGGVSVDPAPHQTSTPPQEAQTTPTFVAGPPTNAARVSVLLYGADPSGKTLSTTAFQKAVDAAAARAAASGQDTLAVVPRGSFIVGRFSLKSGVFLHLEEGAKVLASGDPGDYPYDEGRPWLLSVVYAVGARRVGITGSGEIDGQALQNFFGHWDESKEKIVPRTWEGVHGCSGECRPRLITFERCTDVRISGIRYGNSPDWTTHILGCDNVYITDVEVWGDLRMPNNDGIDPDSSRNVTIENSEITVADDGVCIKATRGYGPVRNVVVRGLKIRSKSSAIKLGSATPEDMSDLLFQNIEIRESHRGLCVQHRDSGNISRVTFSNIAMETRLYAADGWWGNGEPIQVSLLPRDGRAHSLGTASDIIFENINARSENGIVVSAAPDAVLGKLQGVRMEGMNLVLDRWSNSSWAGALDYRPSFSGWPNFKDKPEMAVWIENVRGLVVRTSKVSVRNPQAYYGGCTGALGSNEMDLGGWDCRDEGAGLRGGGRPAVKALRTALSVVTASVSDGSD